MNAGAYGGEMKDVIVSVSALVGGEEKTFTNEEMQLSYRHSYAMECDMIITAVVLRLHPDGKDAIKSRMMTSITDEERNNRLNIQARVRRLKDLQDILQENLLWIAALLVKV